MAGRRSSLIGYAIEAVRHFRPDVFVWENVKGVLFAKHRADLFSILKAFADIGVIDSNGNCLIRAGFYPRIESGYTLSDVLQSDVPEAFFLSEKSIEKMVKHGYTRVLVLGR